MKKLLLTIVFITSLASVSYAQYGMDFGINLGGSNYLGEIGGYDQEAQPFLLDMRISQTNIAAGGFFRYSFTSNIAAKIQVNYTRISGADSLSDKPNRVARNLSFRTDIFETMITGEYSFLVLNDMNRRSRNRIDFRSYAFTGFGLLLYYPYAQYKDKWYYLRPLATEGIENQYDEMTFAVPLGIAANLTFERKFRLGFEVGYRFTFTDYLDDVSTDYAADSELPFLESFIFEDRSDQAYTRGDDNLPDRGHYGGQGAIRGNPDANDGYLLFQFNFSYVIDAGNNFYKSRYNSIINRRRKRRKF